MLLFLISLTSRIQYSSYSYYLGYSLLLLNWILIFSNVNSDAISEYNNSLTLSISTFGSYHLAPFHSKRRCSTSIGMNSTSQCFIAYIKLHNYHKEQFYEAFSDADNNHQIRRLSIHISEQNVSLAEIIASDLDDYLKSRPWWLIHHENYFGFTKNTVTQLVFLRQKQDFEMRLRIHAAVQFPPPQFCEESTLWIGRYVNYGFGTWYLIYSSNLGGSPYKIFDIYDSNTNKPGDGINYVSSNECPHQINRRNCIFIPMTNCSLPDEFTSVDGEEFQKKFPVNGINKFTSAGTKGRSIPESDNVLRKNEYHSELHNKYGAYPFSEEFDAGVFYNNDRIRKPINAGHTPFLEYRPNAAEVVPGQGLLMRPNYIYRNLIHRRISEMKSNLSIPEHSKLKCTAIHIRRGDRIPSNTNTSEYCKNIVLLGNNKCTTKTGEPLNCQVDLFDKGCFHEKAYGELSLQDYLDKAYILQPIKNVFIMTDDSDWLMKEIKSVDSWNIMYIPARKDCRSDSTNMATANGVDFLASIALSRKCSAFVGHW